MAARRNEVLFTLGEFGRALWTFFSVIILLFSHLAEVFVYLSKGSIWHGQSRREEVRLSDDIEALAQSLKLRAAACKLPEGPLRGRASASRPDEFLRTRPPQTFRPNPSTRPSSISPGRSSSTNSLTKRDRSNPPMKSRKDDMRTIFSRTAGKLDDAAQTLATFYKAVAEAFARFAGYLPPAAFTMDTAGDERRVDRAHPGPR